MPGEAQYEGELDMNASALLAGGHHLPPVVVEEFITRGSRKVDFSDITILC